MTLKEELRRSGYVVYTAGGSSMLPLIRPDRDVLVIRALPEIRRNDVVLFERGEQLVLHRVAGVRKGVYKIIGDNCLKADYVRREQILGTLTELRRGDVSLPVCDARYLRRVRLRRVVLRMRAWLGRRLMRKGRRTG